MRAGTAETEVRDGATDAAQTGTQATADGNAGATLDELRIENEKLQQQVAQALAEKNTLERLKLENQQLRSQVSAPPTTGGAAGAGSAVGLHQLMAERIRQHAAMAAADPNASPDSALVVGLFQQNQMLGQQLAELRSLVISDEQQKVVDLQRQYAERGESISPATARKLLALDEKPTNSQTRRDDSPDDVRRATQVVGTRTTGVSASDLAQRTMTLSEHAAKTRGMSPEQLREFDRRLEEQGTVVFGD